MLDALGDSTRARLVASKLRDLQARSFDLELTKRINDQNGSSVVPGLADDEGKPLTYEAERGRIDKAQVSIVALCDRAALEAACDLIRDN
jgi:hypothetical protein